jgi:PST family polysaccharide transporter
LPFRSAGLATTAPVIDDRRIAKGRASLSTEIPRTVDSPHLAAKVRRGIGWNAAGALLTNLLRLATVAILGRLLSPGDFGVVAAALSVIALFHMIRDVGLAPAYIQRRDVDEAHQRTLFAFSLYLGLVLGALLLAIAPLLGRWYGIERSVPVMQALSVMFVLRGISAASIASCQRNLNFRAPAIIDAAAFALGTGVTIATAAAGLGPWALVWGYLTESVVSALLFVGVAPPRPGLGVDRAALRELLGFGAGHTVAQLANAVALQGDYFVVGRTMGAEILGYYTRAYELVRIPATVFSSVVGSVLFPAFSRLQDDPAQLARAMSRTLFASAAVLLPLSAALMVAAPEFLQVLLGAQWGAAVVPFQWLVASMCARTSYKVGGLVARAAGDVTGIAAIQVIYAVLVVGGAALVQPAHGVTGVAASTTAAIAVVYLLSSWAGIRHARWSWLGFVRAHGVGVVGAVAAALVLMPLIPSLRAASMAPLGILLAAAAVAAVCGVGSLLLAVRAGSDDAGWLARELTRWRRRRDAAGS